MSDARESAIAAGRAVVVAQNGECERSSIVWCDRHESRVRKGMSVCDAFLDLLGLMEDVVEAAEPIICQEERLRLVHEFGGSVAMGAVKQDAREALLADLRARVKKLPLLPWFGGRWVIERASVLALFDEAGYQHTHVHCVWIKDEERYDCEVH